MRNIKRLILHYGLITVKKILHCLYWAFYGYPLIWRFQIQHPAVNTPRIDNDFIYCHKSFYPTFYKNGRNRSDRVHQNSMMAGFDEAGIPLIKNKECQYWPVTIAQFGLLNYNLYLTYKSDVYRNNVINACNWMISNINHNGEWEYRFHFSHGGDDLPFPFISAMGQGEGISLLVRGYFLSGDSKYIECAEKALLPFEKDVAEGGVARKLLKSQIYEEYPSEHVSAVLNGFMFSLFGLYDFSCTDSERSKEAKTLFERGYDALIQILPFYDDEFCTKYDLTCFTNPPRASNNNPFYHKIHVNQLIAINSIKYSDIVSFYIRKWRF